MKFERCLLKNFELFLQTRAEMPSHSAGGRSSTASTTCNSWRYGIGIVVMKIRYGDFSMGYANRRERKKYTRSARADFCTRNSIRQSD